MFASETINDYTRNSFILTLSGFASINSSNYPHFIGEISGTCSLLIAEDNPVSKIVDSLRPSDAYMRR